MSARIAVVTALTLALASRGAAAPPPSFTPQVEAQMREAERRWANVAVTGDASVLRDVLADDYVGVNSEGEVVGKADQLVGGPTGKFVASGIDYINYRAFGDTVVAQGAEWLRRADKRPDVRLIWIDIWQHRNGRWQIIASQDSHRPD